MKILLAIPSKNRIKILENNTYQWLKHIEGIDWKIFVEPQDYVEYCAVFGFENVEPFHENNKGLGYAKAMITAYAKHKQYNLIFKLDDDIRGFTDFRKKMKSDGTGRYMSKLIVQLTKCFEIQKELGAIAFPYAFEMYERKLWDKTKRLQTAYLIRTDLMYLNPKVSVFEDFAAGLHILSKGLKVMKYCLVGIDMGVKVGGGTGGHQSFDRKEQALSEVEELRKIYPPLAFRSVEKSWGIEPDLSSVKLG